MQNYVPRYTEGLLKDTETQFARKPMRKFTKRPSQWSITSKRIALSVVAQGSTKMASEARHKSPLQSTALVKWSG